MYFWMSRPCAIPTQRFFRPGCLALLLMSIAPGVMSEDSVEFHYNPPEGIAYDVAFEAIQKRSITEGAEDKSLTENILIKKTISIEKTPEGWIEHHDVRTIEMYRNGQFVNNPLVNATLKRSLQYHISDAGKIQDVTGYEGVLGELQGALPDKVLNRISRVLSPEVLKIRDIVEWNGRFGGLSGQSKTVGSTEIKKVPQQLPSGDMVEFETETHFIGWERCGNKQCFRIEMTYSGDVQNAAENMLEQTHKMTEMLRNDAEDQEAPKQLEAIIEGKTILVLDPATMLPYSEQQDRFLKMVTNLPGLGPVPVEQSSRKTMSYTYRN